MQKTRSGAYIPPVLIDTSPTVRPALNGHWQARRALAQTLRCLNDAVITSALSTEELQAVNARLQAELAQIEAHERVFGHRAHAERSVAHQEPLQDLYYEFSPAHGQSNAIAPPMHIWQADGRVHALVTPGWGYEGPPGSLHGGVISLLFDQLLGIAQRITGSAGVTGSLTVRYHHPTPVNKSLRFVADVDRVEGKKKFMVSELWVDDQRTASCEAVFISVKGAAAPGSPSPTADASV